MFSTPSRVNPERVITSFWSMQLYRSSPMVWCVKPSNCVPTCPISATMISSFEPRVFDSGLIRVGFMYRSKCRVPPSGMSLDSTWPSSMTRPSRISRAALSTVSGPMWFTAPSSSPAPHLLGQRSSRGGGDHDCALAVGAGAAKAATIRHETPTKHALVRMVVLSDRQRRRQSGRARATSSTSALAPVAIAMYCFPSCR